MTFDPFSILPDMTPGITTESPVVFHAITPTDQAPPVRTLPASMTNDGRNGRNMPVVTEDEIEKALTTRRTGRLALFTEERAVTVVEGVEDGLTMVEIAKSIGVERKAIWTWLQLSPGFGNAVARAREYNGHSSADDAVDLLDNVDISGKDAKQNMAELRKAEQRARIRMQLAECFNFRQYGKKQHNLNTNVNATVSPVDLSKYS